MDLDTYWNKIDPLIFSKYIEVYNQKEKEKQIVLDMQNYNLAKYISIGVNNPKKFPKEPFLAKYNREEQRGMTAEEMERVAESMTYKLGGTVNHG